MVLAEILKEPKAVLCVSWAGGELKCPNQVSAAKICLPAWEQIASQPGAELGPRSHTRKRSGLVSQTRLSFATRCFPRGLRRCFVKAGFIFPCPYPSPFGAAYTRSRPWLWDRQHLGSFPKIVQCFAWCFHVPKPRGAVGRRGSRQPARPREAEQLCRGCSEQSAFPGAGSLRFAYRCVGDPGGSWRQGGRGPPVRAKRRGQPMCNPPKSPPHGARLGGPSARLSPSPPWCAQDQ